MCQVPPKLSLLTLIPKLGSVPDHVAIPWWWADGETTPESLRLPLPEHTLVLAARPSVKAENGPCFLHPPKPGTETLLILSELCVINYSSASLFKT